MTALRIAMIAPPFYEIPPLGYGGIELICAELVEALVSRGHRVTLFGAGTRSRTRARFVSTNPRLQHDRLGQAVPELLHAARVRRLLQDSGGAFDIVHDHSAAGPLTAGARVTPTVLTMHGPADGEFGDYYADLDPAIGQVAISDFQRQLRPGLNWVGTVHNGVDPDRFVPEHHPDGPVLWLARFNAEKGPDLAIEACRAAKLPLVLAGKCNEPAERRYLHDVIDPMLGPDVDLVLDPDREAVRRMLTAARCLILPIRWHEPFGLVMIEAMASATPVVALRRGSVPEIVDHGVTGWIGDDPDDLPALLRRCRTIDPAACVARVRRHFSTGIMARGYENVYRSMIMRGLPLTEPAGT
ncbi:glycosyltransferase family 4 protein [Actinoplanes sp. NPDC051851]|uniref:glycosyltransferase family 4 protein n=1 Tax=Actinoplanes sp. NPDC051851 TaxID=3154753 RepID=UPI003436B443